MISKINKFLKRYWWAVLSVVVAGWGIYLAFTCYLWSDGNCTGFAGKTVWDVLELLIIPVTLAGIAKYLDNLERKADRENLKDNQREALLQSYIEFMTQLVLKEGLSESKEGDKVREIAQVKTQTTYERLDPKRNEALVKFLVSLGLVQVKADVEEKHEPIIELREIDLSGATMRYQYLYGLILRDANLRGADLEGSKLNGGLFLDAYLTAANLGGADLSGANLTRADLRGANLQDTILCNADLRDAKLRFAKLNCADLSGAILDGADLRDAILEGANLRDAIFDRLYASGAFLHGINLRNKKIFDANLSGADLTDADLSGINFRDGNLCGANLQRANLVRANLRFVDLEGANLVGVQLDGALMPDGKVYSPKIHTVEMLTKPKKRKKTSGKFKGI